MPLLQTIRKMSTIRFDDRVAVITGAGGGLGRTYALELARRGAKVVVNDLGGDRHGGSQSNSMADKVVSEIKGFGGTAVANYDSVEFGDRIVKSAIDNFGKIDVLINNAGILRDISFAKMKEIDWDLVIKVHLKGAFSVTKSAWPYMRDQKYGKILFTSSNSGIYGSFGQANYAAGAKCNIYCNALIPTAGSRLTETILPEDIVKSLKPEFVTPLAIYLTSESCKETGQAFEAGAGWYGTVQQFRSRGKLIPSASVEDVAENWPEITNMKDATHFDNGRDIIEHLLAVLDDNDRKSKI